MDYPEKQSCEARPRARAALAVVLVGLAALVPPLAGRATSIQLGELALSPSPAWQRAEPSEEAAQDSLILRWTGEGRPLTLFIPQHTAELKVDEARFREQLQRRWRAQYGNQARIFEEDIAGRRWLVCRRPSLEGGAIVFHLATVEGRRAHHLLAVVTEANDSLPVPVATLLARLGRDVPRSPGPARADLAARPPEPPTGSGPSPAAPASLPAPAAPRWTLRRVIHVFPQGEALARIAQSDAGRSDPPVLLSGHGLRVHEHGVHGFIDGWRWRQDEGGRETREVLHRRWRVQWQVPTDVALQDAPLILRVGLDLAATPPIPPDWTLTARVRAVCGLRAELIAAFDALARGARDAPARLARHAKACGPLPPLDARADHAAGHGPSEVQFEIPVRQDWRAQPPPSDRRWATRIVLSLGFGAPANDFGAALWQAPVSHYIYVPAEE